MFRKIIKGLKDVWCGTLEFDTEPKKGSFNPVTSGGVYEAINGAGGAKEIVYFDIDPSDPPSGIYEAIGEALSNNKEPVIKNDGTVYFYSSTSSDKYVFVGGYDTEVVNYTTITVSDDDSVVKETVDTIEGMVFPLYYHSNDGGFTVADKTGHALTKTEIADAYRAGQIFMFSSYPASNTQAHWGYCCDINIESDNTGYAEFFILAAFGGDSYEWEKYRINLSSGTEFVTLWGPNTSYSTGYSGSYADGATTVSVSTTQNFNATQKAQGRSNIGAASASDVTALQSQVSSLSNVSAYSVKGEATVAQLNAGPSGIQAGWAYQLTDSGTLTDGSLAVVAGDTVAWDGTKWFPLVKSDYYATKTYAQNVAHSIAPEYNGTTGAVEGKLYMHEGSLYRAKVDYTGSWIPANFVLISVDELIKGPGFVTDSVVFEGAGTTTREYYVKCYPGMEYEVVVSATSWSCPGNVTAFGIYSCAGSSSLETHYQFFNPSGSDAITLPSKVFKFKTNSGAESFRIMFRGTEGVSLSIVSCAVFGEHPPIERTVNLFGKDMTFVHETAACYPNMDYEVSLSLNDWNIPESASVYSKLVIQSVDSSGNSLETHFSYSNTYGPVPSVLKFKTHANAVAVKYSFRGNTGVVVNAFQKISIYGIKLDEEIDVSGANLTSVEKFVKCFPSCWYGIEVLNTSWELSSNSSEYTKLAISTFNGDSLISDKFIYMNKSGAIPSTFKFKTEENATQIRIYFRGKSGSSNKFIVRVLPISKEDDTPHVALSAKMVTQQTNGLLVALNPDTHGDVTTMDVYREYIQDNGCDVVLGLGDHCASHFDPADLSAFFVLYAKTEKPIYAIVGNHDVGNSVYVGYAPTRAALYNALIKPSVDAGYLVNGEYSSNKMYYYHDFVDEKVRLICIDDYDQPFDFDDTYWEAVAYDSSRPNVQLSQPYVAGDIVNCVGVNGYVYDGYSFKAKSSFTTESSYEGAHLPQFKLATGGGMIGAAQAQWLLDTMCSTPANYTVYIATHKCFSPNCTNDKSYKFAEKFDSSPTDYAYGSYMQTDFIANAINAFMNGSNYSEDVVFSGSAEYLNVDGKAYTVSKDFSAKNSGVKFGCCINGHTHNDLVFRHNTYTNIISVNPVCVIYLAPANRGTSDVYKTRQFPLAATLISLGSPEFVKLIRAGVSMTMEMYRRDFEKISLSND